MVPKQVPGKISKYSSSTATREKRGEIRTPRDTQGLYKTGITPQKEDRARTSKNITSNTEDSITTLITKVDTTEKGITIGKAENVYITIIRCACTSALNPSCPCKRSTLKQSCQIVNAKLLASESTDPRLHTPESDRRKFSSVKWSPGREVQLVVRRKPKAVPENAALTTAKAHTPSRWYDQSLKPDGGLGTKNRDRVSEHKLNIEASPQDKRLAKLTLNGN
ncbi:hypothetical protein V3C99_005482 [Haemonchus contortus]